MLSITLILMSISSQAMTIVERRESSTRPISSVATNQLVMQDGNMANDANSLRQGIVEEINFNKHTVRIRDQVFNFDLKQIRVFSSGQVSTIKLIVKGSKIGFLLNPLDKTAKKIAVMYLY